MPPANLRSRRTFQRNRKTKNRVPSAPNASISTASDQQPSASAAMVHHSVAQRDAQLQGNPIMGNVEAGPSVQIQHQLQQAQAQHAQPPAQHFNHQQQQPWAQRHEPKPHQQQKTILPQGSTLESSQEQSTQKAPGHAQPQKQSTAFSHEQESVQRSPGSSSGQSSQQAVQAVQVEPLSAPNRSAVKHYHLPQVENETTDDHPRQNHESIPLSNTDIMALQPILQQAVAALQQELDESLTGSTVSSSQPIVTANQPLMHNAPMLVQAQSSSTPGPAPLNTNANVVTVGSHPGKSQGQSVKMAVPSRVIRSAAPSAQQSCALTKAMNPGAGAAAVPYHFVTPSTVPKSEQIESGNASNSQTIPERKAEDAPATAKYISGKSVGRTQHGGDSLSKARRGTAKQDEGTEEDIIAEYVAQIKAWTEGPRTRPLICQDITSSNADTLRISRLPRGVTYDKLYSMVEPFGDVEELSWCASDPYVCEVTYRDPAAAHEAKHFLGDALVGSDSEPPLKAELHSRDPGAQLFVGDLTPDVTEEMLEQSFSKLVGEPVKALLKRDPDTFSPIGYGFLSFLSESSANFALVAGHRVKIGNACVRVGRAERNTYLYVSDLSPTVTMSELTNLFGRFGALVDEDTVIVRRSYAFVRYKNRNAAEKAKRTLDKTDLKGRISVRYAEAEPLKECVAVQFHSSVPRPPNSLRDLVVATFSKHGNCSVEIPRLSNGMWRKVAFVTFHGDPVAASLAALDAVQTVRFVSSLPVCCQFARELIPRLPAQGLGEGRIIQANIAKPTLTFPSERVTARLVQSKKSNSRRSDQLGNASRGNTKGGSIKDETPETNFQNDKQGIGPNFVPIYVPIAALQHPNAQIPPGSIIGPECMNVPYQWSGRVLVPGNASGDAMAHPASNSNPNYAFGRMPDPRMKW